MFGKLPFRLHYPSYISKVKLRNNIYLELCVLVLQRKAALAIQATEEIAEIPGEEEVSDSCSDEYVVALSFVVVMFQV